MIVNYGDTRFVHNTVDKDGGAVYVLDSAITLKATANFTSNSAQRSGGAMYFESATLNLEPQSSLLTFDNHASQYGGAI